MEINPRVAFERMFGRAGTPERAPPPLARGPQHPRLRSSRKPRALQRAVSAADRGGSTTISRTCARSSGASSAPRRATRRELDASRRRSAFPSRSRSTWRVMFDLLAVAYQADLTRVFTFMTGREASQRTYPGPRHERDASRHVASRPAGRQDGAAREDQHATSSRCSPTFLEQAARGARRRRLACSITR